ARVRAARGVDEGAPERLRRNADVKRSHRGSDRDRGAERRPAIRRGADELEVVVEVLPRHVQRAVGPDERIRADSLRDPGGHGRRERDAVVGRRTHLDPQRPSRRVPGDVYAVDERAPRVRVDRDHRLVVEHGGARLQVEEGGRPRLAQPRPSTWTSPQDCWSSPRRPMRRPYPTTTGAGPLRRPRRSGPPDSRTGPTRRPRIPSTTIPQVPAGRTQTSSWPFLPSL